MQSKTVTTIKTTTTEYDAARDNGRWIPRRKTETEETVTAITGDDS